MLLIFSVFYIVLLCVCLFGVGYCNVRYCFRIQTVFGLSLLPVVCRMMSVWVWWCPTLTYLPCLCLFGCGWCSILTYLPCLCLFGCGGVRHLLICLACVCLGVVVSDTNLFALLVFVWVWWYPTLAYLPCLCLFGCGSVRH